MKEVIKIILLVAILSVTGMFLIGCEDENDNIVFVDGYFIPPPIPQGVYSITGDEAVAIYWLPVDIEAAPDFDFYVVYRSDDPVSGFMEIGTTNYGNEYFIDTDVSNGTTYFYAVSSVDYDGNLSDLSYEDVFDTPRPEGFNKAVFDFNLLPAFAGWDLSDRTAVSWDDHDCDFFLEFVSGDDVFYINVGDDTTDIQDMGYTSNLDEISYSPETGWSQNGWTEVILGHTYIIWTADNHFAKIRVTAINNDNIIFDWAYQVDPGNPELKPRPPRSETYLRYQSKVMVSDAT